MNARTYTKTAFDGIFDLTFAHCADEMAAKRAYRAASLLLHPDVCRESNANEMFIALGNAYAQHLARLQGKTTNEQRRAADDEAFWEARRKERQAAAKAAAEAAAKEAERKARAVKMKKELAAAARAARELESAHGWFFGDIAIDVDGDIVALVTRKVDGVRVNEWRAFWKSQWTECADPQF